MTNPKLPACLQKILHIGQPCTVKEGSFDKKGQNFVCLHFIHVLAASHYNTTPFYDQAIFCIIIKKVISTLTLTNKYKFKEFK